MTTPCSPPVLVFFTYGVRESRQLGLDTLCEPRTKLCFGGPQAMQSSNKARNAALPLLLHLALCRRWAIFDHCKPHLALAGTKDRVFLTSILFILGRS